MPNAISELGLLLAVALLVLMAASLGSASFLSLRRIAVRARQAHGPRTGALVSLLLLLSLLLCGLAVAHLAQSHLRSAKTALLPFAEGLAGGFQQGGALQRVDEVVFGTFLGLVLTLWFGMLLRGRTGGPDDAGFRLTTFSAAFLFCAAVLLPYLDRWMTQASNVGVEGWGFTLKLSLQQPENSRTSEAVFGPQGGSVDRAAALSGPVTALDAVIGISRGAEPERRSVPGGTAAQRLCDIPVSDAMPMYRDASVMQRDMLMAAYLGAGNEADFNRARRAACGDDGWAWALHPPYELFAGSLGPLACARHYANKIRDFRLLLLDIHEVLRAFLALSARDHLSGQDNDNLQRVLGAMVHGARTNLRQFGGELSVRLRRVMGLA